MTNPITPTIDQQLEQLTEEELLQKVIEYRDLSKRLAADYQNLQRETDRQVINVQKFATEQLLLELCPLVDYFDSAFATVPETDQSSSWLKGIYHIRDYLMKILREHQVTTIEALGQPFNPNLHEAVSEIVSDQPAGTVVQQTQAGFYLNGKVIRPAKVIIAKTKLAEPTNSLS
ncbi:MAG: nucleotide exchange factor GrpE [Candidatus Kerfeldbacteria bacterium]|nr:nucleotide exchange factor GrpE [Candidatus Kerfeldbacteria bacterium]